MRFRYFYICCNEKIMLYRLGVTKMVYAIISEKDNQTSLAYFKSKKIPQGNFVPVSKLQQLDIAECVLRKPFHTRPP